MWVIILLYCSVGLILSVTAKETIVTIVDDDVVTVMLERAVYNASEGDGVAVVRVMTDVAAANDLSLGLTVTGGTAQCKETSHTTVNGNSFPLLQIDSKSPHSHRELVPLPYCICFISLCTMKR